MAVIMATDSGTATGTPLNDCFGTKTETAGTAIRRLVIPRVGARSRVSGFAYLPGATAHTLTFMTVQEKGTVTSEAASGQAVVSVNAIATADDGGIAAAGDLMVFKYEDGTWAVHEISSISGLNITMTANFAKKVPSGSAWYFMGVVGDHTDRAFYCAASVTTQFNGSDSRVLACTSNLNNEPIVASSDNGTNAGRLLWLAYTYELSST